MSGLVRNRISSTDNSTDADASDHDSTVGKSEDEDSSDKAGLLMNYVTKEYELLKLVLGYLPVRDLNSAAQVCRAWTSAADIIKQSRIEPHWLLWHQSHYCGMEEFPAKMFGNHIYSEPQLCLCFMTGSVSRTNIDCRQSKAPCPCGNLKKCTLSHRVVHYLRAQLLPTCPCVLLEGSGVVGTEHDLSLTMEIEKRSKGYSCLLLPKVPGTVVTLFQLDKNGCLKLLYVNTVEEVELLTGVPPATQPIRCLLLFASEGQKEAINNLVATLQSRQEEKIAVGGGICSSMNLGNIESMRYKKRFMYIVGVAFCGENVTAASTILNSNVVDKDEVDEVIHELQACKLPTENSLGFMFACVGRGKRWYNQPNVESASFRSHFPSTPLMGYFGNGEIGLKHLPVPPDDECERLWKRARGEKPTLLHTYSTVIVYVSLGSKTSS